MIQCCGLALAFHKFGQYTFQLSFLSGGQENTVQKTLPISLNVKTDIGYSETDFENMAMIGMDAMQRANSTLEDFVSTYLLKRVNFFIWTQF